MDTILLSQLSRIEIALSTLLDSITSYNPSIPAAQALLSADSSLQHGLKQLHTHQRNNARILQLREKIAQQNAEVTSSLQLLADTRSELLAIPTSLPPKERRDVSYRELLDYAKRISRFTMPPDFRPAWSTTGAQNATAAGAGAIEGKRMTGAKEGEGVGLESLQLEEKQWLDPWTGVQFTPWPGEDVMRRSALAQLQVIAEKGEDAGEAEKLVKEDGGEDEGLVQSERLRREKVDVGMGGTAGLQRSEEKPKVFGGLDLYDPDEEG